MATNKDRFEALPLEVKAHVRRLVQENEALKRTLAMAHGHDKTRLNYQADVLEDRFLPSHASVTFRIDREDERSHQGVMALLVGDCLEITAMAGSLQVKRITASRIELRTSMGKGV